MTFRPFVPGERALLFDNKGRRYLVTLAAGGEFHTHSGPVAHDELLGQDEGTQIRSSRGARYIAVRPTLADVVLKMPRGAQVIYPKDLGPILILADVFPGARVFESGLGSGALSMALLRAGAVVTGYELRDDFAARAQANVAAFARLGRPSSAIRSASGTATRHRRRRPRPDGARPARTLAGGHPRREVAPARRHPGRLPPDDRSGGAAA